MDCDQRLLDYWVHETRSPSMKAAEALTQDDIKRLFPPLSINLRTPDPTKYGPSTIKAPKIGTARQRRSNEHTK